MTHNQEAPRHAGPTARRHPRSDGGRRSRHGAGRTPQAGAAAQAASGSRSWCHQRGRTARAWRPARGRRPSRRRAALRTAPMAPRSAGPGPGLAKSPPRQASEHMFGVESGMLPSATGWIGRCPSRSRGKDDAVGRSDCGPRVGRRRAADGQQPVSVTTGEPARKPWRIMTADPAIDGH
jgi:hypothetical protein